MEDTHSATVVRALKQLFLVISVLYFYIISFALLFHLPTFGLDTPPVYLAMGTLFLAAICLEILLAWWHRRKAIMWGVLGILAYGVIGLYLAPLLYGQGILVYVLLEPLVITFIGGFAFVFGHLLADAFSAGRALSLQEIERALERLPGWTIDGITLRKVYRFDTAERATHFVHLMAQLARKRRRRPHVRQEGTDVDVVLSTEGANAITHLDLAMAREIDAI
jgi:pterin-4a-carbinolamine dehydratase